MSRQVRKCPLASFVSPLLKYRNRMHGNLEACFVRLKKLFVVHGTIARSPESLNPRWLFFISRHDSEECLSVYLIRYLDTIGARSAHLQSI